jgi:hypothetical protein
MRQAMESIAADAMPLDEVVRNGICRGVCGHRGVERGIEHGNHRNRLSQHGSSGINRHEARRIVKRRQHGQRVEVSPHGTVESNRFDEAASAVDDPVPDAVQPVKIDVIEEALHGVAVISHLRDRPSRSIIPLYGGIVADAGDRTAENGRQIWRKRLRRRTPPVDDAKF